MILSNNMAILADAAFDTLPSLSAPMAWLGAVAYGLQIYFDFSGYSDMAIGMGRMFGFHFLENFDRPYLATSITDFWRRWHISLSTWFRDYVYIPLGGNRVSAGRHLFNLFVVWLLTGIWHGANWTFLLWGLGYFLLLMAEKYGHIDRRLGVLRRPWTLFWVLMLWVLFRAENVAAAGDYFAALFSGDFRDPQLGRDVSQWISDNTQGLLAPELEFDKATRLAVVNALYFRTTWMNEFDPQRTSPQEFTRADGSAVTADFMHANGQWTSAWLGENYTIASMGLSSQGVAFFVLPEEGTAPQELLENPGFWEGLGQFLDGGAYTKVNWSVPKFTVDSQYQLEAMLPQLGFDTACDPEAADFSGISEVERLTLSQTSHGVHFAIDEEGIEAAAYTATGMSGSSGPPPKEIDMVLDRPFLYGVTAFTSTQETKNGKVDSTLLFLGACGDPTAS